MCPYSCDGECITSILCPIHHSATDPLRDGRCAGLSFAPEGKAAEFYADASEVDMIAAADAKHKLEAQGVEAGDAHRGGPHRCGPHCCRPPLLSVDPTAWAWGLNAMRSDALQSVDGYVCRSVLAAAERVPQGDALCGLRSGEGNQRGAD